MPLRVTFTDRMALVKLVVLCAIRTFKSPLNVVGSARIGIVFFPGRSHLPLAAWAREFILHSFVGHFLEPSFNDLKCSAFRRQPSSVLGWPPSFAVEPADHQPVETRRPESHRHAFDSVAAPGLRSEPLPSS